MGMAVMYFSFMIVSYPPEHACLDTNLRGNTKVEILDSSVGGIYHFPYTMYFFLQNYNLLFYLTYSTNTYANTTSHLLPPLILAGLT